MKIHVKILGSLFLLIALMFISSQAYASEVTGTLSSSGIATTSNNGSGLISGTVVGGSSGGGGGGGSTSGAGNPGTVLLPSSNSASNGTANSTISGGQNVPATINSFPQSSVSGRVIAAAPKKTASKVSSSIKATTDTSADTSGDLIAQSNDGFVAPTIDITPSVQAAAVIGAGWGWGTWTLIILLGLIIVGALIWLFSSLRENQPQR